jgi:ElaB/YqjD/DUF883 family membrane-anchored ribosome-binding protein
MNSGARAAPRIERSFIMSRADSGNTPEQQGGAAQLRETAGQMAGQIRDMGSQVRDAATQQYDQDRDSATEYYQQGRDKAMELQHQVEDYVREQPIKAVLMAAGIGALLGILWKRS